MTKKLSKEELSRIRSEAGRKGAQALLKSKNFKGGRPKGSSNKNPVAREPSRTMTVRQSDYEVFVKCAFAANLPQVELLHRVAENLKAKNPQLFAVEQTPVNV